MTIEEIVYRSRNIGRMDRALVCGKTAPIFGRGQLHWACVNKARLRSLDQRGDEVIAGFHSASGFIRREIGKSLGLRYTPELDFEFDPALERAARIDALLKQSAPKD